MSAATSTILTIGALGASGGLQLFGAHKQAKAAEKASTQQQQSAQEALKLQQQMYETSRGDLAPYRQQGGQGLTALTSLLGLPAGAAPSGAAPTGAPATGMSPQQWQGVAQGAIGAGAAALPGGGMAKQSAYGAGAPGAPTGDMVPMRSPDGKLGYVPRARVAAATAAGGQVVQ